MKYQFLTAILFCSIAFSASALDDSKENREFQAKRYMASQPSEEMLKDMAKNMSMNFPPEQRKDFRVMMLDYVDLSVIDEVSHGALVKYFTAELQKCNLGSDKIFLEQVSCSSRFTRMPFGRNIEVALKKSFYRISYTDRNGNPYSLFISHVDPL